MKKPRPAALLSVTAKQITPDGSLYATITYKVANKPFEVFASLGKAGATERAWAEALTRCISTAIRYGVPAKVFVDQLVGIQCSRTVFDPMRKMPIHSTPEGIGLVLKDFIDGDGHAVSVHRRD